MQNVVNLGAVKVTSNPNIEYIDPEKRNCYFDHEHPPNQPLTAHKKYSQVRNKNDDIYRLYTERGILSVARF